MTTPQRFNALGPNHRDCPICGRVGTLTGDRVDGAILECTGGMAPGRSGDLRKGGCCARFTYAKESFGAPATLTRLAAPDLRAPLNAVCGRCGRKACSCGFDNGRDPRADFPGRSR